MDTLEVEKLYNYLKEKYGVENTEKLNFDSSVFRTVNISIPKVRINNIKHVWTIHLEKKFYPKVGNITSLVIGESFADQNTPRSGYIEIKECHNKEVYPDPLMEVAQNIPFKKEYDFKTLYIFTKVLEEFFQKERLRVLN